MPEFDKLPFILQIVVIIITGIGGIFAGKYSKKLNPSEEPTGVTPFHLLEVQRAIEQGFATALAATRQSFFDEFRQYDLKHQADIKALQEALHKVEMDIAVNIRKISSA